MSRVVGVDVGGTNCKLALLDEKGTVLQRRSVATDPHRGAGAFTEALAQEIEGWLRSEHVTALGCAVAGLLDNEGVVRQAPNLPAFEGWRVADDLSARLGGLAVLAENDVNALAYGELCRGAARDARHAVVLALGTGVGGAILIDRRLYRGTSGVAGELGHVTIQADGPDCTCGQPGHVEAYLGTRGIQVLAGTRLDAAGEEEKQPLLAACRREGELTTKAVAAAAAAGDPLSISILADIGRLLGLVCAGYVNIFNPDVIVIGGGVAQSGDLLLGPARKSMKERAMPPSQKGVRLVAAELGPAAAAIGAGLLALHTLDESGETES